MDLNTPVSSIMTASVVSVSPAQKLADVKHIFEKKDFHHHLPVTANGKLVGMISLYDYLYAIKGASINDDEPVYHTTLVSDIMHERPVQRPSHTPIRDIASELAKGEIHAIVITDGGTVKGIVSTADLIRHFLGMNRHSGAHE